MGQNVVGRRVWLSDHLCDTAFAGYKISRSERDPTVIDIEFVATDKGETPYTLRASINIARADHRDSVDINVLGIERMRDVLQSLSEDMKRVYEEALADHAKGMSDAKGASS